MRVTRKAIKHFDSLCKDIKEPIRITLDEAKCQYRFVHDRKKENDIQLPLSKDASLLLDKKLAVFLQNTVIDWEKGVYGDGFSVSQEYNPECTCGQGITRG